MKASLVMSAFSKNLLGDLFLVIINEWMNEKESNNIN
jgi:hypothetical protein